MRTTFRTGGFEDVAGYSRAVRVGDHIAVSATAPTDESGSALHPGDTYAQTRLAFERAIEAVSELGGRVEHVTRTRMYLVVDSEWRRAVDAHLELFADIQPANSTFYVAGFIPDGVLVEVELDAIVEG
jgi:enamine deaminase RidA (YjgF/YER057c/UK114 family)